MINRRRFLTSLGGLPFALNNSFARSMGDVPLPSCADDDEHLDLAKAKRIKERWLAAPEDIVDLSGYSTACVWALDHLAGIECGFLDVGVRELSPSMARSLADSAAHYLIFSKLEMLTPKAALALGRGHPHHLVFERLIEITPAIAKAMVDAQPGSGKLLDIRLPFHLTPELAAILATDSRELWLSLVNHRLSVAAAQALALHQGESLRLTSALPFTAEALEALSQNPRKHIVAHTPSEQRIRYRCCAEYGRVVEVSDDV